MQENVIRTVVFADLAGYGRIVSKVDDVAPNDPRFVQILDNDIQYLIDCALQDLGIDRDDVVFATSGDDALILFENIDLAHEFSHALNKVCSEHNSHLTKKSGRRWFSIGVSTGNIIITKGKQAGESTLSGIPFTIGARLQSFAEAGESAIDETTFQGLSDKYKLFYGSSTNIVEKSEEIIARVVKFIPKEIIEESLRAGSLSENGNTLGENTPDVVNNSNLGESESAKLSDKDSIPKRAVFKEIKFKIRLINEHETFLLFLEEIDFPSHLRPGSDAKLDLFRVSLIRWLREYPECWDEVLEVLLSFLNRDF